MKTLDYYRPRVDMNFPFESDYTYLTLVLKGINDTIFDTVTLTEKEYKSNKRDYKNYEIINTDHKKDLKKFDDLYEKNEKLIIERKVELISDLASENGTTSDIVKKAIKCLEFSLNEFADSLSDYVNNCYSFPKDMEYNEYLFKKEIELITDYINILK